MFLNRHEGRQLMCICLKPGFDWMKEARPMLPDPTVEWCPATHFGYLQKGEMKVKFNDGSEQVVKEGESYLVGPGHLPQIDKDTIMIEFSQDPTWSKAVENSK